MSPRHSTNAGVEVVGYDPLLDADQAEDALPFDVRREDPFESVDAVVILCQPRRVRRSHASRSDRGQRSGTGGRRRRRTVSTTRQRPI